MEMNEGVSGWYGLIVMGAVVSLIGVAVLVLGAAAMRLMLKDDVYFPEEK